MTDQEIRAVCLEAAARLVAAWAETGRGPSAFVYPDDVGRLAAKFSHFVKHGTPITSRMP